MVGQELIDYLAKSDKWARIQEAMEKPDGLMDRKTANFVIESLMLVGQAEKRAFEESIATTADIPYSPSAPNMEQAENIVARAYCSLYQFKQPHGSGT